MPRILIVDDDYTIKLELEEMLTAADYDVVGSAENGTQAVEMAHALNPDLILMDIVMPGEMDGITAAETIKQKSDTAIVFITGYGDPEYVERAKVVEPLGYVMKPFDEKEIRAVVEIALYKRDMELKLEEVHERLERTNLDLQEEIAARKKIERALRESEGKYRTLSANIPGMVYRAMPNWSVEIISNSEIISGYSINEFATQKVNWLDLIHRDDKQQILEEGSKLLKKELSIAQEYRIIAKDGSSHWVSDHKISVFKEDGSFISIDGIVYDITKRKRMEEDLSRAQKMEAIGTLTGGIAHDYNNLMSIIMGNLSMAQEEAEPGSDLADFLNEANMASHKARDLTHELMSLSKGGRPVREVGSLNEVLKNVSEFIPADSGISLMESISQDLKLVPYDRLKMRAVIKNVVKNAVEAMPDGGTLKIKAENLRVEDAKQDSGLSLKLGDFVHVSIQDQGKGIPKEHLDKIFDPYFSTKAMGTQKGMGLGLATAYAIVQKHGGHIAINSSSGAGTTVNIYLPAESHPEEIHGTTTSADDKASPVKRVLVMDDEEMLRKLARQMLERMGYAVETVKDGVEAIALYKSQKDSGEPFDAVILDLTIKGGMGGEQTIRELLEINPDVKAIVSSGYFDDPVMSDFKKYGFMGALPKPYEKKALKEVLERLSE